MKFDITITDIARELEKNPRTIGRWINWYYSDLPKPEGIYLPDYTIVGKNKMYKATDIVYFREFEKKLPRGAMREYNNYFFNGKRNAEVGEKIKASSLNQLDKKKRVR